MTKTATKVFLELKGQRPCFDRLNLKLNLDYKSKNSQQLLTNNFENDYNTYQRIQKKWTNEKVQTVDKLTQIQKFMSIRAK